MEGKYSGDLLIGTQLYLMTSLCHSNLSVIKLLAHFLSKAC